VSGHALISRRAHHAALLLSSPAALPAPGAACG
jgi:hypothetical protein